MASRLTARELEKCTTHGFGGDSGCFGSRNDLVGKTVDLATRTDSAGTFEIGFCSRPSPDSSKGWPGHAFVSFSWRRPNGQRDFTAIGHTVTPGVSPAAAAWSLFGSSVSGMLAEERYTSVMQECLIVRVNREDYDAAVARTQSPLQTMGLVRDAGPVFQAYRLAAEDCVTWAIGVAQILERRGLKVPMRLPAEPPLPYLRRMILAN